MGLEKGIQAESHEFVGGECHDRSIEGKNFPASKTHCRGDKHPRRCIVSPSRPEILPSQPVNFSTGLPTFSILFKCGPFANHENRQIPHLCSWRLDRRSLGNAWDLHWGSLKAWANPTWELISKMLQKTRPDRATILVCLQF